MMRINLLPHREEKRKLRQKQFGILAGITVAIGLVVAGFLWFAFDSQIENQKGRNQYLNDEIVKLDKQIDEIKKIREETASLLAKKQVVEGLQSNRSEPVYLLDQLLRQLPEGLYLKSIKQTGIKINVTGYAQSNARVSAFMRNIEASPYLENPNLLEIKAVTVNSQRANEFSLDFAIKRAKADDGKGAPKKADPAKTPGKKA
ncbi:MAG: PilN domain-containing protein [Betaproteobacteria bacterium]|nr:PilN domain-containing protein [Betaproteobacteria bacterium]